jgi:uncharacterized membrane protein YhaH (DUF805 family)
MQYDWKRLFLSADGRIGRQEFWIGFLLMLGVSVILRFIPILGTLATLALIYPQVCVGSKRLHDIGKSGYLMILPFGVCAIGFIAAGIFGGMAVMGSIMGGSSGASALGASLAGMGLAAGLAGLAVLFALGFTIWVGVATGQPGENQYGPAPEAPPPPVTPATPV